MIFVDFFVSGAVYFSEPITRIYRAAASRPRGGVAGFLVSLVTEILLSQNIQFVAIGTPSYPCVGIARQLLTFFIVA